MRGKLFIPPGSDSQSCQEWVAGFLWALVAIRSLSGPQKPMQTAAARSYCEEAVEGHMLSLYVFWPRIILPLSPGSTQQPSSDYDRITASCTSGSSRFQEVWLTRLLGQGQQLGSSLQGFVSSDTGPLPCRIRRQTSA